MLLSIAAALFSHEVLTPARRTARPTSTIAMALEIRAGNRETSLTNAGDSASGAMSFTIAEESR